MMRQTEHTFEVIMVWWSKLLKRVLHIAQYGNIVSEGESLGFAVYTAVGSLISLSVAVCCLPFRPK